MSELRISTDPAELDFALVHRFLSTEAYWSLGIPEETVRRAIAGSLCFGGYVEGVGQVAFARVISDFATFAYLADVFVLPAHRGRGYSKQLVAALMAHPQLQGLRRLMLVTSDAHGLYARHGFAAPAKPQMLMEISRPGMYAQAQKRMNMLEPGTATHVADVVTPVADQFEAYNRHDLQAFLACFAENFRSYRMPAEAPSVQGKVALAEFYAAHRFNNPALRAELISRIVLGNKVFDHERIHGLDEKAVETIAVFEVEEGLIRTAWFYFDGRQ